MKASGLFPTLCYLMSFMGYSLATGGTIPKPLVDSQSLRLRFNQTSLLERANYIESLTLGSLSKTRTFGDEAHIQTVEYIYTEAQKYGYNVWKQEVIGLYSVINELGIKAGDRTITPHGFYNSGSVKLWIKTELVVIHEEKGCNDMDYADAVNKTVLIDAGSPCGLGTKINTAVNMGVTAILFQSEHPEDPIGDKYPYWGELPPDFDFPVAAVTRSEGEWLTTWAKKGEMMELKLDYVKEERKTFDVFAQTTDGDQNNVVMLGANSDSPVMGPGMNDNGSGFLALVEIMAQLSNYAVNNAIRFSFWSAMNGGVLGFSSRSYIQSLIPEERAKIKMYINLDALASPNHIYSFGHATTSDLPPGTLDIEKKFENYFTDIIKTPIVPSEVAAAHPAVVVFREQGVPVGSLFSGTRKLKTQEEVELFGGKEGVPMDPNAFGEDDLVKYMNLEVWEVNVRAAAHVVAVAAGDLEWLQKKKSVPNKRSVEKREEELEKRRGSLRRSVKPEQHSNKLDKPIYVNRIIELDELIIEKQSPELSARRILRKTKPEGELLNLRKRKALRKLGVEKPQEEKKEVGLRRMWNGYVNPRNPNFRNT